jgi:hypothetical protein
MPSDVSAPLVFFGQIKLLLLLRDDARQASGTFAAVSLSVSNPLDRPIWASSRGRDDALHDHRRKL